MRRHQVKILNRGLRNLFQEWLLYLNHTDNINFLLLEKLSSKLGNMKFSISCQFQSTWKKKEVTWQSSIAQQYNKLDICKSFDFKYIVHQRLPVIEYSRKYLLIHILLSWLNVLDTVEISRLSLFCSKLWLEPSKPSLSRITSRFLC